MSDPIVNQSFAKYVCKEGTGFELEVEAWEGKEKGYIRDGRSEVWGSGGNWLGMEAPEPRGSVCEQAQPQ